MSRPCECGGEGPDGEPCMPECPLHAAAPDMLAALERLVAWGEFMGGWEGGAWKQAAAAIAKAKGTP